LKKYQNGKWIRNIGRGAYALVGDNVEWTGAVYALQTQLGLNIHIGGKTALALKGHAHYLPLQKERVYLYGSSVQELPKWFLNANWNVEIVYFNTKLFPQHYNEGLTQHNEKSFSTIISSPERAALELVFHVPNVIGFQEAILILESLSTLRPLLLSELLKNCKSIKAKRVFMFIAEKSNHPWAEKIDLSDVNFGQGKRQIIQNGVLDKKYLITVPRDN
jgi:tRNA-binding EMAP/Myf-like protein